jgi:molybdopterin converting factor small subunit
MPSTVRVRYYAQLRDALKTPSEEVSLDLPARERDVLERLAALHPRQRDIFLASRVAVDDAFLAEGARIDAAGNLDIISPISGG